MMRASGADTGRQRCGPLVREEHRMRDTWT